MAGQPLIRAVNARIHKAGGEEYVFTRVAEGKTLKEIAEEIGVSRQQLSTWCNHRQRRDALARARREAATALVEEGLTIADGVQDPTEVPVAKLRADYRRWMAGKLNREAWGDQQGPLVNINLGDLHLEALKAANRPAIEGEARPEAEDDDDWMS